MRDRFHTALFALSALGAALIAIFGPDDWFPKGDKHRIGILILALVFGICATFTGRAKR